MSNPVAAIEWRRFKREGADYLRQLALPESVSIWAAATLYLRDYELWRKGKRWNPQRCRYEMPGTTFPNPNAVKAARQPKGQTWRTNAALSWARNAGLTDPAWTEELETKLLSLRESGLLYREIALHMGKTKGAIQARMRYLALGRRLYKTREAR